MCSRRTAQRVGELSRRRIVIIQRISCLSFARPCNLDFLPQPQNGTANYTCHGDKVRAILTLGDLTLQNIRPIYPTAIRWIYRYISIYLDLVVFTFNVLTFQLQCTIVAPSLKIVPPFVIMTHFVPKFCEAQ